MAEATTPRENETRAAMASDTFTLFSFVDEVESKVEFLRKQATALMGERASLLMIMDQLKNDCMDCDISPEDCQELVTNMERLKARCQAVEIQVHTVRDEGQVQSLEKVNSALEELQTRLNSNQTVSMSMVQKAHSYLNACLPEAVGPVDSRFQSLVLGCAVDDQKDVRHRLQNLLHDLNLERETNSCESNNSKDKSCVNTDLSNNSARLLNSPSASRQIPSASSSLPSDVVVTNDESPAEDETDNHLKAQWYSTPKNPSHDKDIEQQPAQPEGTGTQAHPEENNSRTYHEEHNMSWFNPDS